MPLTNILGAGDLSGKRNVRNTILRFGNEDINAIIRELEVINLTGQLLHIKSNKDLVLKFFKDYIKYNPERKVFSTNSEDRYDIALNINELIEQVPFGLVELLTPEDVNKSHL